MPLLLFCIAFGLSMDYEVFLLSRIKELHDAGATNSEAVAGGLARTGRIVTTAAALLAVNFFAFGSVQGQLHPDVRNRNRPSPSWSTPPSSGACSCRHSCAWRAMPTGGHRRGYGVSTTESGPPKHPPQVTREATSTRGPDSADDVGPGQGRQS